MDSRPAIFSIIVLSAIMASATTNSVNAQRPDDSTDVTEFIVSWCKVTRYPQLCVSSLSPYAGSINATLRDLVKLAMQVSLNNSRSVTNWADDLKEGNRNLTKEESAALDDCIENFGLTNKQIQESVTEIEQFTQRTFNALIDDMQLLMNFALINEGSCIDSFANATGNVSALVTPRVQTESKLISNALALIDALAKSGGDASAPL